MSSHCDFKPKSVEAKNHKYLPLASQTGHAASESPSVTCFDSPVSTLLTKIALYIDRRWAAYATHFESGLHVGFIVRVGTIHGSLPTILAAPLATSMTHAFRSVSVHRIFFESGDHDTV